MTKEILGVISGEIAKAEMALRGALGPLSAAIENPFYSDPCQEIMDAQALASEAAAKVALAKKSVEALAQRIAAKGDAKRPVIEPVVERVVVISPHLTDGREVIVSESNDIPALQNMALA